MDETKKILKDQAERAANYRTAPQGGVGMPEGMMFFFGAALLIAACFVYMRKDNTAGAQFVSMAQDLKGDINTLQQSFDAYKKNQGTVCESFTTDIEDLKKRSREPQVISYTFPKSIPVSVTLVEKHEHQLAPPTKNPVPQAHSHRGSEKTQ